MCVIQKSKRWNKQADLLRRELRIEIPFFNVSSVRQHCQRCVYQEHTQATLLRHSKGTNKTMHMVHAESDRC